MSPIKIIHLLPSNIFSGAEHVVFQIMDLFENDPNYEMYYVSTEGPIETVLKEKRVKYRLLHKFSYGEIKKIIRGINPSIIHAHDFRAGVMAAIFAGKDIQIISHLHNNWPWIKKINIKTLAYALSLFKIAKVFGVSQSIYEEYIFRLLLKNKFFILPNMLNADIVYHKAEEFTIPEAIDLLFVGRLSEQKNPLLFVKIAESLIKKGFNINAVMLGDGELKQSCQDYITKHNLEKYISLKGFLPNPYPYMKAAKILVMPSLFEGFGLVALEAAILGSAVVGTPVGGLKDILKNCGFIAKTEQEFIDTIENLLCGSLKLEKNQNNIKIYTDLPKYKKMLTRYYKEVLGGKYD